MHRERRELGVDHGLVGGVLARRWGLPNRLAAAIERHHSAEAEGESAIIRLADMLAHYGHGQPVDPAQMLKVSRTRGSSTAYSTSTTKLVTQMMAAYINVTAISTG